MADNAENLQPWLKAVGTATALLALAAVALRMLSRWVKQQPLWWDDWLILLSMVWYLVVVIIAFFMINLGMGLHFPSDQVSGDDIVLLAKYLVANEILYVYNLVWTKMSFLLFFYRIFRHRHFKRWAYVIGSFVVVWVICITFLFIFICVPVEKLWYPELEGRCINQVATWYANSASTILSDLAILLLPLPEVWKLNLKFKEKLAYTFLFCSGFFVVFASAYRLSVLFSYRSEDPSYTLAPTVGWTAIEVSAGIISACLPTLLPAIRFLGRSLGIMEIASRMSSYIRRSQITKHTRSSTTEDLKGSRTVEGDFHRLHDYVHSRGGGSTISEIELRPDIPLGMGNTVTSTRGRPSTGVSDEQIPLHSIKVKTAVEQTRE